MQSSIPVPAHHGPTHHPRGREERHGPPRGRGDNTHPTSPIPPLTDLPLSPGTSALQRPVELRGPAMAASIRVALRAAHWLEEVESGRRPATHLRTLLLPTLAARWSLRARTPRSAGRFRSLGPVQFRRRQLIPVCNLVLLFEHDKRVLPHAFELVLHDGDWYVSDLARPGMSAPPALPIGWGAVLSPSRCQPLEAR